MRFLLDNDVDARVAEVLRAADSPAIVTAHLEKILESLKGIENVVLLVSESMVKVHPGRWE